MAVLPDRIGQAAGGLYTGGGDVTLKCAPFAVTPAVVASAAAGWLVIDLFPRALPDVGDDERTGSAA